MSVTVNEEIREGIIILSLRGKLDATALPILEKQLNTRINEEPIKMIFDFTEMEYLSSAGMRLLLSVTKKLKSLGGRLVVCNISPSVMQIIKLAGFDNILTIQNSLDRALDAIKS